MKITLYIPCYNSEENIADTIKSAKNQSLKPDEIIVVDDSSTDRTAEIAKEMNVRIISHPKNKGIGAARNTALENAENNLVAALDSDVVADKQWLSTLYKCMEEHKASIVGGKIIENISSTPDKWRKRHITQDWGNKKRINPKFIAGNNFLCVKKDILEVGSYEEKYTTNYEDVDICQRLKKKKYDILYEPRAKVRHKVKDNEKSVLDRHWRHMFWDYPKPNTIIKKILRTIINAYTSLKFITSDIIKYPELIVLNIKLFFHHTRIDLLYSDKNL